MENSNHRELYPALSVFSELREALRTVGVAVLTAPPGAGKSTALPAALLKDGGFGGKILMLEPRRVTARAIASRVAELLGESVGETVGYRMRGESRVSSRTRLEIVTEGLLTRKLQADPALDGVELVIFDEFHERNLASDLGLALCREVCSELRPDLKLLLMSATLDAARIADTLRAPAIVAEGRSWPLEIVFGESASAREIVPVTLRTVHRELADGMGSLLVFLPGAGEIQRAAASLAASALSENIEIHTLYGAMDSGSQDRAIRPAPPGKRKIVLATNIAETGLTIEGVSTVIDSGWERRLHFDPASGLPRLELGRISRASAAQRAGRAGRTGPGRAVRCYAQWEYRGMPDAWEPEIACADLSGVALELALWGNDSPLWLEPPPPGNWAAAQALLGELDLLDDSGKLTDAGRRAAATGVHPRLAAMLLRAAELQLDPLGAELAALLEERDGAGDELDLTRRLELFRRQPGKFRNAVLLRDQLLRAAHSSCRACPVEAAGRLLAAGFPDRIARCREPHSGKYLTAGGRGAELRRDDDLAGCEWLVIPNLSGGAPSGVIRAAAPLDETDLRQDFPTRFRTREALRYDTDSERVIAETTVRFGAIELTRKRCDNPDPEAVKQILLTALSGRPRACFVAPEWDAFFDRIHFAHRIFPAEFPEISDEFLLARFAELYTGERSLAEVRNFDWRRLLDYSQTRHLDRQFPERFEVPTGSKLRIDYSGDVPALEVRVQELYGQTIHPVLGGGAIPLKLVLLSPAHRPVQITTDLPGFWAGSWALVRKEMKSRYPKHEWPEDPAHAQPTTRAKTRVAR